MFIILIATFVALMASQSARADFSTDKMQIRYLAAKWQTAWNTHEMKAMAGLFTDDADFVNVAGHHWKGRKNIEAEHLERLPQFKDSVWTNTDVEVAHLRPDIVLSYVNWGNARRYGSRWDAAQP